MICIKPLYHRKYKMMQHFSTFLWFCRADPDICRKFWLIVLRKLVLCPHRWSTNKTDHVRTRETFESSSNVLHHWFRNFDIADFYFDVSPNLMLSNPWRLLKTGCRKETKLLRESFKRPSAQTSLYKSSSSNHGVSNLS